MDNPSQEINVYANIFTDRSALIKHYWKKMFHRNCHQICEVPPKICKFKKEKRKEKADVLSCNNQMLNGFLKRRKPKGKVADLCSTLLIASLGMTVLIFPLFYLEFWIFLVQLTLTSGVLRG